MNFLLIGIFFVLGLLQTIRRGPGSTFALVYLPVLLLVSTVKPVSIEPMPDITSPIAVCYGALLGMVIKGKISFFKPHLIDYLVLLCSITIAITGFINGEFWTLVSATGNETLQWLVPYYMARVAFQDALVRRQMGLMLCYVSMAMGVIGIIEFRLYPLFFSRMLDMLNMTSVHNTMVLGRFGLFRAMVTAEHPIDLGNVGLILGGLIPGLCVAGGIPLRDKRVIGGLAGAAMIILASLSFSSIAGAVVAFAIYIVLRYVRGSELLLVPGLLAAIVAGFVFTNHLLTIDREAIKPVNAELAFDGSYYIRVLIIQRSWESYGQTAGLMGYGDDGLKKEVLGLESVDNSYMLFLMRRGWVHLTLRLVLACTIAFVATRMLTNAVGEKMRLPVASFVAALLGTMVSMYTVWFGFVYAILWTCALAMFVTMRQIMAELAAARDRIPYAQPQPHGLMPHPMT